MSEETKKELKNKKNKKKKHPFRTFISLSAIFISCFLIYGVCEEFVTTLKLKNEIFSSESSINDLESQQAELTQDKKNLENPEYVKRYVRGKYMLSKPGEQVFKLPSKGDTEE